MKEKVKQIKFNFVVAAILYIVLGLVLLLWPDTSSSVICYAIGAVLLIHGVIGIIAFLSSRNKNAVLALQLVVSVAAAVPPNLVEAGSTCLRKKYRRDVAVSESWLSPQVYMVRN